MGEMLIDFLVRITLATCGLVLRMQHTGCLHTFTWEATSMPVSCSIIWINEVNTLRYLRIIENSIDKRKEIS